MPMTDLRSFALVAVAAIAITAAADNPTAQSADTDVAKLIEPIRQEHRLPALGAAIVTSRGLVASGVTGTRKAGTDVAATIDDQWHLGSDTKAMTAVILATFVERGTLTWETTLGEVFTELAAGLPADFRAITITQLLSHHAGLPANLAWRQIAQSAPTLPGQRLNAVKIAATATLGSKPGTKFEYSNLGYVLAGAIAERIGGKPWEELMREIVFTPLGMTGCGFGGLGTPGTIDQPWPHTGSGRPTDSNGPAVDNAAVLGPAGTVHCSIADWSKFIADQLRGERGGGTLLKAETYKSLHAPRFGGTYAFGWGVTSRVWSGGTVLQHSGSNTMNFCVVWVAPLRDMAVLAVTNQAGDAAQQATDEAVAALIRLHEKR
jgi:CubicO group peptidase (beta-lactamase class C family)